MNVNNDIESSLNKNERDSGSKSIFKMNLINPPLLQNENYVAFAISEPYLLIANKNREIYRWFFKERESLKYAFLIPNTEKAAVSKIFCNQKGQHAIICLSGGKEKWGYYFNIKSQKIKELYKVKEFAMGIECIGWDEKCNEATTNQFLVGTEGGTGSIYTYQIDYDLKTDSIKEKITYQISIKSTIYGIAFDTYNVKSQPEGLKYIIAVTDKVLYQFTGSSIFDNLFKKYKENPKAIEKAAKIFPPGDILKSQLQIFYNHDNLSSFSWLTGAGLCYGEFRRDVEDLIVKNFLMLPYAKIERDNTLSFSESPISIAQSEHHFYFLFHDNISVISKITNGIVYTEYINKGSITHMNYDRFTNSIWLYSARQIYQMTIENEDRDVWKGYLETGSYQKALDHCESKGLPEAKKVARLYAQCEIEKKNNLNAAILYGKSDEKFEEVTLRFLVTGNLDALKAYLQIVEGRFKELDKTQQTLLSTWLVEIYLNELNNTKDPVHERSIHESLKDWLKQKIKHLDKNTIYQLLQQYGRVQELLEFAELKADYESVILAYINEKDMKKAIVKLHEYTRDVEKTNELYNIFTKYSHIFMKHEPELTIELLLRNFKNNIDPNKIISAIMSTEIEKREKVVDYLEDLIIHTKIKDKNIHNLFIFFLSQINSDTTNQKLLNYLSSHGLKEKPQYGSAKHREPETHFDIDYAFNVFSQFKIYNAQAYTLSIMGKWSQAVKVALDNGYVKLAKDIANNVEDQKVKKLLWLDIFISEMSTKSDNINLAMEIMNESKILKIEDVLPNLMDNIKIEVFKSEITNCIDKYENNIQELKRDITNYNQTAEYIKSDIGKVKKKYIEVKYSMCQCEICLASIKDDNIFIFPCGHMFDVNCIIRSLQENSYYMPALQPKIEKILVLKNEIEMLERRRDYNRPQDTFEKKKQLKDEENKDIWNSITGYFGGNKKENIVMISYDEMGKLTELKDDLTKLLCEECVLCGEMMVESIGFTFDSPGGDKSSWMVL